MQVQCNDTSVASKVEANLARLCAWIEKHPGRRGQVCLSFYEKRKRQNWLGRQEERLFWEQWCINFSVLDPKFSLAEQSSFANSPVQQQRHNKLQAALEEILTLIIRLVNEKKEHIPPVVSASTLTFPFEITIAGILTPKRRKVTQRDGLTAAQQLLKDKIEGDGKIVAYEFERLRRSDNAASWSAELAENDCKNRYASVLPFDSNRVFLMENGSDYINASYIESKPGELPRWQYICTQGPLHSTTGEFWLMVYQQRSSAVIMLTRTVENAHIEKCAPYFPTKEDGVQRFGQFTVKTVSRIELSHDITVRELWLTHQERQETRKVMHYHYHAWPDHGVPKTTAPLRQLSALLRSTRGEGTPVVHCSAGIGRTGTFCTIDIVLRRLQHIDLKDAAAAERTVDIKRVVSNLRKQRAGMVQTPGQYLFCHQAVKEEIDSMLGVEEAPLSPTAAQSPLE